MGGLGSGGGGRGHFIHLAMYCTTTWCFALKGLRTITAPFDQYSTGSFQCLGPVEQTRDVGHSPGFRESCALASSVPPWIVPRKPLSLIQFSAFVSRFPRVSVEGRCSLLIGSETATHRGLRPFPSRRCDVTTSPLRMNDFRCHADMIPSRCHVVVVTSA